VYCDDAKLFLVPLVNYKMKYGNIKAKAKERIMTVFYENSTIYPASVIV
jgi:hypothetical protein